MDQERRETLNQGSRNNNARLTPADVLTMRRLRREGATFKALADQFGVEITTAWNAVVGKSWSHLPDTQPRTRTYGRASEADRREQ